MHRSYQYPLNHVLVLLLLELRERSPDALVNVLAVFPQLLRLHEFLGEELLGNVLGEVVSVLAGAEVDEAIDEAEVELALAGLRFLLVEVLDGMKVL